MKVFFFWTIILFATVSSVRAQDSTSTGEVTGAAKAALYAMTGIFVPLAAAGTVVSFFPPSFGVIQRNGVSYAALGIETGIGFGEKKETGVFTDYRFTLGYTHIYNTQVRDIFHLEAKRDFHFGFVDRRKIFLSGMHYSVGLMSDFPNHGYTLGAGAWVKSPWLSFFGFFPSHTYGITYRYNKYFGGNDFHEILFGVTSALTF